MEISSKMKKTIGIVIGAGSEAVHAINKAREQGVYVVALDGNPDALGFKYADEALNVDISDVEKVCTTIEKIEPDFVIPVPIGRYLSTTGYVNEKYGLKGVKYRATELSTDKYLFHQRLYNNGLRNIELYLINSKSNIDEIHIPYPAIMKPRFGSGSRDVFYINNDDELIEAYNKVILLNEDFVLEQAVVGTEYGIDGVVINGKLDIILVRKKIITPLPMRQATAYFSVTDTENNIDMLNNIYAKISKTVEVLEYDNCLLHADLIINNEEIFVIEISPRPSGHNLHNVFVPMTTGIDIIEEYLKFLKNEPYNFTPDRIRCTQIRFFDFSDVVIERIPTLEELNGCEDINIIKWNCNIKSGEYMGKVTDGHSIMGRGFFIIEGENQEDLERQSNYIMSKFDITK